MKQMQLAKKTKTYKLFIYGTLKAKGKDTHYVYAYMWNIGQFPGIILGGKRKVAGQLITVTDYDLKRLDRYEGVPNLYKRKNTTAYGLGSKMLGGESVFIYEWARGTDGLPRIIEWNDGRVVNYG